jgi:drug/metabolite transporter (DMT)-like permease
MGVRLGSVTGVQLALLVVGVVGVSMSAPLIASAAAVPALAMAMWRSAIAAALLAPVAAARHRAELTALPRRELVRSCFSGLMLAAHFAFWIASLQKTSVASSTALVSLQAGWVVVFTWLAGQPVVRRVWSGVAVAFAGVLVVSGVDFSVSTEALVGDLLALLGGVFSAVYVIVGGRVREVVTTTTYTLICYATSASVLLLAGLLGGVQLVGFSARDWGVILAVTFAAQLLGHSVFNYLLATMSPTIVSMTILLEVPGAALLAAVFLGQAPPVAVYAGLALILGGLALVVGSRSHEAALAEAPQA